MEEGGRILRAARDGDWSVLEEESVESLRRPYALVEQDSAGVTALQVALRFGRVGVAARLVDKAGLGAIELLDVVGRCGSEGSRLMERLWAACRAPKPPGAAVLAQAARSGSVMWVDAALRSGACEPTDFEAQDAAGGHALIFAAASGNLGCVARVLERLKAHGMTNMVNAPDMKGVNALGVALGIGHRDLAMALVDAGARVNATAPNVPQLFVQSAQWDLHAVLPQFVSDLGLPPDTRHNDWTPLQAAAFRGSARAVDTLLDLGACPDAARPDGSTPLHLAAHAGYDRVVARLARCGVAAVTSTGVSPLFAAVEAGHVKCVEALLAAGANPCPDISNPALTPISAAAKRAASSKNHRTILELLVAKSRAI